MWFSKGYLHGTIMSTVSVLVRKGVNILISYRVKLICFSSFYCKHVFL